MENIGHVVNRATDYVHMKISVQIVPYVKRWLSAGINILWLHVSTVKSARKINENATVVKPINL